MKLKTALPLFAFVLLSISCNNRVIYWPQEILDSFRNIDDISLITDALIIQADPKNGNFPLIEKSTIANEQCFSAINNILKDKDYSLGWSSKSFQGAFLPVNKVKHNDSTLQLPPFEIDTTLFNDTYSLESFLWLHRILYMKMKETRSSLDVDYIANIPNSKAACRKIKEKVGSRYLFINNFFGMYYSTLGFTSKLIGTAILANIMSFGHAVVINKATAGLKTYSFLIDLENAKIVWSRYYFSGTTTLTGNEFMLDLYNKKVLKKMPVSSSQVVSVNNHIKK